jgi:hypothetical protein
MVAGRNIHICQRNHIRHAWHRRTSHPDLGGDWNGCDVHQHSNWNEIVRDKQTVKWTYLNIHIYTRLHVYMYMSLYIYIYIYIYIYSYTYCNIYMYIYIYIYVYICIHLYICVCVYMYIYSFIGISWWNCNVFVGSSVGVGHLPGVA